VHVYFYALFARPYLYAEQLVRPLQNAFAYAEPQSKIFKITGRRHHYGVGYAVIDHGNWNFFRNQIV